jgi:hypothetical protein
LPSHRVILHASACAHRGRMLFVRRATSPRSGAHRARTKRRECVCSVRAPRMSPAQRSPS